MNNLHFQDFGQNSVNPNNDSRPLGQIGDHSYFHRDAYEGLFILCIRPTICTISSGSARNWLLTFSWTSLRDCWHRMAVVELFTTNEMSSRGGTTEKKNFFSFEFYQQYFDVDTDQVMSRILNSMVPRVGSNFITDHIQPLPDLWGPFWISVTLVFSTAICGNLAKYIQASGDVTAHNYGSDFRLVTGASTIIFCYVILVPFILYSLFWYRKSDLQYSYMDLLCAYGYSLSIFVPVSVLWVLQAEWFRWTLIFVSVVLSGTVLMGSIWPAIKNDRNRTIAMGTIFIIVLLHSLLAVGFKEYYFDASLPTELETGNLHQQVRIIEKTDTKLKVAVSEHPSVAPLGGTGMEQTKVVKTGEGEEKGNISKQENVATIKVTEKAVPASVVPAAAVSKPT